MKRAGILAVAAVVPHFCLAQSPFIRAAFEPAKGVMVGQPVRLVVTVFVPNYFSGGVDFPEFDLDGAIVVLPQDHPQHLNEQVAGVAYAGISATYTIYPQQPGDFHLPRAELAVPYASAPPTTTTAHLALPALTLHAEIPAAAQNLDYFLPTTSLTIQQKWSVPLKNLRAGDTVERTITVTAAKMQAMLIPPLAMKAPDGVRVYPGEPAVQDQKTDRGEFVSGRRVESAKYFIQKEGDYTLPEVELQWWNLSTNRLVTATLPAVHFTAAANPNYAAELPPEVEPVVVAQPQAISTWVKYRFWIRVAAPCFIAALLLGWVAWRYLPRQVLRLREWRAKLARSEGAYCRSLLQACQRNQAKEAYQWLLRWMAVARPGMSLDDFLSRAADPALVSETNALGASLFAEKDPASWRGARMADLLKRHRQMETQQAARRSALPDLNP
jgi:hypothetical protein